MDRLRLERQKRSLALDHADGNLDDAIYLERMTQLRADVAALDQASDRGVSAERAIEWLRVLAANWQQADLPEAKAELIHAVYDRIVVVGPTIVGARLTTAAYANGLALALPQMVMARPEGFEPPTI